MKTMIHTDDDLDQDARAISVEAFWAGVAQLEQLGIPVDHSRNPKIIALNMPSIAAAFQEHGIGVKVDSDMQKALRAAPVPSFLDVRTVDSYTRQGSKTCWRFARPDEPMTLGHLHFATRLPIFLSIQPHDPERRVAAAGT